MNFVEINGVTPCVHYTKNGTVDFTRLTHDIIHSDERNQIIATHILVRYKTNFLVLVSHLNHAQLIEKKLQNESLQIINQNDLNVNLVLNARIVIMTFNTFDKICTETHKVFKNYNGLLIASPHKNINNIIDYIHRNHLKITIYDIDDNNELLNIWTNDHCNDFELYKVLHHVK